MAIRQAIDADMPSVAAIFGHYVEHSVITFEEAAPSPRAWRAKAAHLQNNLGLPFLVVDVGGQVVGFAYAAPWRDKPAYRFTAEDTIYLAPDATGRGLGSRLLARLIGDCTRAGIRHLLAVIADTGDPASQLLHLRYGFTDVGRLRRVGYKHNRWVDTILMQLELAHPR